MQEIPIDFLALTAAIAARIVIGIIWFSPFMFGNSWMRMVNCSTDQLRSRMPKALVADLLSSCLMAFVLYHAVHYAGAKTVAQGLVVGFFNWLGLVGAVSMTAVFYENRPVKLFLLTSGYQSLSIMTMSAIIASWT